MATAVDEVTDALQTFNKAIDIVLKEPQGPRRWRAANNLWLSLSSEHRKIYREVYEENRLTRESLDKHGREIGLTKSQRADKTLREALNIPAGAYVAISKADPQCFLEKKNSPKFFKEFKEYTTRRVL